MMCGGTLLRGSKKDGTSQIVLEQGMGNIVIQAPSNSGSLYFSYEATFSAVLLVVVYADYRFLVVDMDRYGSNIVGAASQIQQALRDGTLNVPPPAELRGAPELRNVNHVTEAD